MTGASAPPVALAWLALCSRVACDYGRVAETYALVSPLSVSS